MSTEFEIAVLEGDGIGPEVMAEALRVLDVLARLDRGLKFHFTEHPCGAGEYLHSGNPLPETTLEACGKADAILLGAMGLPNVRWPGGTEMAPQIDLRERLDLYAGVRPIRLFHESHTPLKRYSAGGIDFVIFRESTEGMFASRLQKADFSRGEVNDTLRVTRHATERICRAAFHEASRRRGLVTLVDKANVLPSMAYFRSIFDEVATDFPSVRTERVYVDAAALYLVRRPEHFDVLVMENLFGDILSDLAAGLIGGMGMAPSADIGDEHAVFQPSHGSAPDIAGQGMANPVAMVLSVAMMLDHLNTEEAKRAAERVRTAIETVLADPSAATPDLGGALTTGELGGRIVKEVERAAG